MSRLLNASDKLPLWYQLAVVLRSRILRGEYRNGETLPPETQLAREFGVSRATIRQALQVLVDQGLIARRRGAGTFVTGRGSLNDGMVFTGYLEDLVAVFAMTKVVSITVEEVTPPPACSQFLQVERVVHLRRVREIDGKPFAVADTYLPPKMARPDIADLLHKPEIHSYPVVELLEYVVGAPVAEAIKEVTVRIVPPAAAQALGLPEGTPILFAQIGYRDRIGNPLAWTEIYYHPDHFHCRMRLIRFQSDTRRRGRPRKILATPETDSRRDGEDAYTGGRS